MSVLDGVIAGFIDETDVKIYAGVYISQELRD